VCLWVSVGRRGGVSMVLNRQPARSDGSGDQLTTGYGVPRFGFACDMTTAMISSMEKILSLIQEIETVVCDRGEDALKVCTLSPC
jgi:hypothetical protein